MIYNDIVVVVGNTVVVLILLCGVEILTKL